MILTWTIKDYPADLSRSDPLKIQLETIIFQQEDHKSSSKMNPPSILTTVITMKSPRFGITTYSNSIFQNFLAECVGVSS